MALNYAILLLYALLPFQVALNPAPGFDVALVRILVPLIAFWWLAIGLKNKSVHFSHSTLLWLIFSFLFWLFFSLFFAQNIFWGLRKLFFILTLLPIYFVLCYFLAKRIQREKFFFFLTMGSFVLSLLALFQFVLQFFIGLDKAQTFWAQHVINIFLGNTFSQAVLQYPSWLVNIGGKTYLRALAIFPDPHMLAFYLNMSLPFAFWVAWTQKKNKVFFFLVAFAIFLASLLTFSRGGYLGLLAIFLLGLSSFLKNNLGSPVLKRRILLTTLFLSLLLLLINSPVKHRFLSSFDQNDGSNEGRMLLWKQTLALIKAKPWGVGLGNYALAIEPTASYRDPIYAHNLYLDIAAEAGLAGLFFWLSLILGALWFLAQKASVEPLFGAGFLSLVSFAVHSLVENPLFSVHNFLFLMLLMALASQKINENS